VKKSPAHFVGQPDLSQTLVRTAAVGLGRHPARPASAEQRAVEVIQPTARGADEAVKHPPTPFSAGPAVGATRPSAIVLIIPSAERGVKECWNEAARLGRSVLPAGCTRTSVAPCPPAPRPGWRSGIADTVVEPMANCWPPSMVCLCAMALSRSNVGGKYMLLNGEPGLNTASRLLITGAEAYRLKR